MSASPTDALPGTSFDAAAGAEALAFAFRGHDEQMAYRHKQNARLFEAVNPKNRALQLAHEGLID